LSSTADETGGGIYLRQGVLTLSDSTLQGNTASDDGGGLYVRQGTVNLDDDLFQGNTASDSGGGVYVHEGAVALSGNTFQGNGASYGGGGVYAAGGTVTLDGDTFQSNWASYGGGVRVSGGAVTIGDGTFQGNTASYGGGAYIYWYGTTITLNGNDFRGNSAQAGGGVWVYIYSGSAVLSGNTFQGNIAASSGGGVYVYDATVALSGNTIQGNAASTADGGGLYVRDGDVTLSGNTVLSNTAGASGGGIAVRAGTVEGQNDVVARNTSTWDGVYLFGGTLTARHWTLAENGSYGLTTNNGGVAVLTNTIVASHTLVGFWGFGVTADDTLFFDNGAPCGGGAACTDDLAGDPSFLDPVSGNYHIAPGSAALDQGVGAGVTTDIDGEPRPLCFGYDVGADELMPGAPVASFTSSAPDWMDSGTVFTNTTSVTGCVSYLWAFGDGAANTEVSPTHAYATPAIPYTVVLTAANDAGTDVATGTVDIYAALFASSSPDWLGQTTLFTNTTVTSGATTYQWSFGDGVTSPLESPVHGYAAGLYTVVLTATNYAGSGVATSNVAVYGAPTADFTADPTTGPISLTVAFADASTTVPPGDPTLAHHWDFGDGGTSTLPNPSHTYVATGTYTVTLVVSNAIGSDALTRPGYIAIDPPLEYFRYLPLILHDS
jgi:PKD repeat protein